MTDTTKQSPPRAAKIACPAKTPVEPVKPPAPYIGGKRALAKRITQRIDADSHTRYCEVFMGMGGIFFRRTHRPRAEFINDYSEDVSTLFRILQRHYPQFLEVLRFGLTTRAEFERLARTDPSTLTDLERAARFLYLQRTGYAGKVVGRTFGVSKDRSARFNLTALEPMLEDIHTRLAGVTIERLDFEAFIARYDSEGTLFYLDPPYWGVEGYYGKALFARADFERLTAVLRALEGRFILSINDTPETRALFKGFDIETAELTYSASPAETRGTRRRELIVSNGMIQTP